MPSLPAPAVRRRVSAALRAAAWPVGAVRSRAGHALDAGERRTMSHDLLPVVPVVLVLAVGALPAMALGGPLTAKWIWAEREDYGRYNDLVVARRTFALPGIAGAQMAITADTRYRLFVNGEWVSDGPCRSWPKHYQYDVLDVAPYLRAGENKVRVVANYFGTGTFHQVPQQAGLLVELSIETPAGSTRTIVSDESWEVADVPTRARYVPKKCVMMGPYEIYDARLEGRLEFRPATVLFEADGGPWQGLHPRDCRLLSRNPFHLKRFVEANVVADDWMSFGFRNAEHLYPGLIDTNHSVSMLSGVATVIRCDSPMTLHVNNWGYAGYDFYLNGQQVAGVKWPAPWPLELKAGPNLLLAVIADPFRHWARDTAIRFVETEGFRLENPLDGSAQDPWCFLMLDDGKHRSADWAFRRLSRDEREAVTGRIEAARAKLVAAGANVESLRRAREDGVAFTLDSETQVIHGDPDWQFKARRVVASADGLLEAPAALMQDNAESTVVHPAEDGDVELLYDFGEQNCGYYELDLVAEEGLLVDVAQVEYIDPAGRVQHTDAYRNSMRYVCKEGRNRFVSLWRRSGRYLFVTLRNQTRPAAVRSIRLIESTYPVDCVGHFACSDPELDRIWEVSARTLKLCMEDTFTDCPLYEQTLWVGDARSEALLAFTPFGAEDLARRCILLAGQSLEDYPLVLSQVPTTWETILPGWAHLWGVSVWDYYFYSGDRAFIEQVWPMVIANLEGADRLSGGRYGASMLHVGAVNAALKCADLLGDAERAEWLRQRRAGLVAALNERWDDELGGYAGRWRRRGGAQGASLAMAAQGLLYDVVEEENREAALQSILVPVEESPVRSSVELLQLCEALEREGHQDYVIELLKAKTRPMLEAGASTFWEHFPPGVPHQSDGEWPTRSHCHGWSSIPVHFFNRILLGIVPAEPGGRAFTISPRPHGLAWARGASATINGPVEVGWRTEDGTMFISTEAPPGARLEFAPNDSIEDYAIVWNGQELSP
jgi:hypothetical protein